MRIKKAFTLAEIMIVLTVIGILTAILMPIAMQSAPDENVLKFKKANATLGTVIRELVNSDKYYFEGDLAKKPDGSYIVGSFNNGSGATSTSATMLQYFCRTLAEVLTTKSVNCSSVKTAGNDSVNTFVSVPMVYTSLATWEKTPDKGKEALDTACKNNAAAVGAEIVTADDVVWYQSNPAGTFGVMWGVNSPLFYGKDNGGFYDNYKPFCIDVDGIGTGEDPFGYGIRVDGKILTGKRADLWIEKSVQRGED